MRAVGRRGGVVSATFFGRAAPIGSIWGGFAGRPPPVRWCSWAGGRSAVSRPALGAL